MRSAKGLLFGTIAIGTICFTAPFAQAQVGPPGADSFATSAQALAKSADDLIEFGRASERLEKIRKALSQEILKAEPSSKVTLKLDTWAVLCDVRATEFHVALRRNYLNAVGVKIADTGKPATITDLSDAVGVLFGGQSVDVIDVAIVTQAQIDAQAKKQLERCQDDLKNYELTYYGVKVEPGFSATAVTTLAIPIVGQVGSLIEVIKEVFTPVIVEGARIVDERQRRKAIRTFLTDEANRTAITKNGEALGAAVSRFVLEKRYMNTGTFAEAMAVLRKTEINLAELPACANIATARFTRANWETSRLSGAATTHRDPASDDFAVCWRAAWAKLKDQVATIVKAADDYDRLADAGDSNNAKAAFEKMAKALKDIAIGSDSSSLAELWADAMRLVAFAKKLETAFSKENRDKIHKALDDLVKGS